MPEAMLFKALYTIFVFIYDKTDFNLTWGFRTCQHSPNGWTRDDFELFILFLFGGKQNSTKCEITLTSYKRPLSCDGQMRQNKRSYLSLM